MNNKRIQYDLTICIIILVCINFAIIGIACLLSGQVNFGIFLKYDYYGAFINILLAIIILVASNKVRGKRGSVNTYQSSKKINDEKIKEEVKSENKEIFLVSGLIGSAMIMLIFYMILK